MPPTFRCTEPECDHYRIDHRHYEGSGLDGDPVDGESCRIIDCPCTQYIPPPEEP